MENRNNGIRRKKLRSGVQREQFRTRESTYWRYIAIGGNIIKLAFVSSEVRVDISKIMSTTDPRHGMYPHVVVCLQGQINGNPESVLMAINYRHYNNTEKLEHIRSIMYQLHLYLNVVDDTAFFGKVTWMFNERNSMVFSPDKINTSLSAETIQRFVEAHLTRVQVEEILDRTKQLCLPTHDQVEETFQFRIERLAKQVHTYTNVKDGELVSANGISFKFK